MIKTRKNKKKIELVGGGKTDTKTGTVRKNDGQRNNEGMPR